MRSLWPCWLWYKSSFIAPPGQWSAKEKTQKKTLCWFQNTQPCFSQVLHPLSPGNLGDDLSQYSTSFFLPMASPMWSIHRDQVGDGVSMSVDHSLSTYLPPGYLTWKSWHLWSRQHMSCKCLLGVIVIGLFLLGPICSSHWKHTMLVPLMMSYLSLYWVTRLEHRVSFIVFP
jgi:hypothetical protein